MSHRVRALVFLFAAAGLLAFFAWGIFGLPGFGHYAGAYGLFFNAVTAASRHITNVPTAVNFDFRGIDTMGEEYILFGSVVGTITLLRTLPNEVEEQRSEADDASAGGVQSSDAVRFLGLILTGLLVLFGIYVVLHAHLTPGGGFQGGAMVGTAALVVYLTTGYQTYSDVSPMPLMELGHASGAGSYIAIGLAGLMCNGTFLQNFLPLGTLHNFLSGGMIPLINDAVGLEVSIGFAIIFFEFVAQTHRRMPR
jgi:multicomponent Na+:H+ antiporter subunit B